MRIAFFDFDGTLIVRDSGRICALPSIRRGLVGPGTGARLVGTYLLSKLGLRARTDAMRAGFACYRGRTLDELRGHMQALYDEHLERELSPAMKARVEEHRAAGDRLVIVTASAFFFAEPIARDLGIDRVIGTDVGFVDGICTGTVVGDILDGAAKLRVATAYALERRVPLAECTFYTDHVADLPLLEAVGTPVAVGPHAPLAKVARARGWTILPHG